MVHFIAIVLALTSLFGISGGITASQCDSARPALATSLVQEAESGCLKITFDLEELAKMRFRSVTLDANGDVFKYDAYGDDEVLTCYVSITIQQTEIGQKPLPICKNQTCVGACTVRFVFDDDKVIYACDCSESAKDLIKK